MAGAVHGKLASASGKLARPLPVARRLNLKLRLGARPAPDRPQGEQAPWPGDSEKNQIVSVTKGE